MKKITYLLFVLLTTITTSCHKQSVQERLASDAKDITDQCPIMIDTATQLDSMTYTEQNHTVTYHYTINGALDNDSTINAIKGDIRLQQTESIKNSVDLMQYKQWKVNLEYDYYSKTDGHLLFKMIFTPKDYQ